MNIGIDWTQKTRPLSLTMTHWLWGPKWWCLWRLFIDYWWTRICFWESIDWLSWDLHMSWLLIIVQVSRSFSLQLISTEVPRSIDYWWIRLLWWPSIDQVLLSLIIFDYWLWEDRTFCFVLGDLLICWRTKPLCWVDLCDERSRPLT